MREHVSKSNSNTRRQRSNRGSFVSFDSGDRNGSKLSRRSKKPMGLGFDGVPISQRGRKLGAAATFSASREQFVLSGLTLIRLGNMISSDGQRGSFLVSVYSNFPRAHSLNESRPPLTSIHRPRSVNGVGFVRPV